MKHEEEVASLQSAAAAAEVQAKARVAALTQQLEQALAAHKEATAAAASQMVQIIGNARIENVCKSQSCMVSKWTRPQRPTRRRQRC